MGNRDFGQYLIKKIFKTKWKTFFSLPMLAKKNKSEVLSFVTGSENFATQARQNLECIYIIKRMHL